MNKIINEILEKFDSLDIGDQEALLKIQKQRLASKRREEFLKEVSEAEKEYAEGKYVEGNAKTLIKEIENEAETNESIYKKSRKTDKKKCYSEKKII